MHDIIESRLEEVHQLCRRFDVQRLDVFGSAARAEGFDAQRSDIDFVVDFGPGPQPDLFNRYFGLNEALAALFGRKVDLVMSGGMVNPYFIDSVNRTRQLVYARPLANHALVWSTVQTQLPALLQDVQGLLPQRP